MKNNNTPSNLQVLAEAIHGHPEEGWHGGPKPQEMAKIPEDNTGGEPPQEPEEVTGTTGNISVYYKTNRVKIQVTHDRITEDNCTVLRASPEALSTTARLFKSKSTPIGAILNLFSGTRVKLQQLGLRTFTGGVIVRATHLDSAQAIFDEADDELERLKGEVRRQYSELVAEGKKGLGDAHTDVVYPSAEEVASGWKHRLHVLWDPSQAGASLLQGVSDEAAAKTRAMVKRSQQDMLSDSQSDLIKQLLFHIIGNGKSDEGILGVLESDCILKQGRFQKLKERLEQAKNMNWIELPQLNKVIELLEPIANVDLDELRANDRKRHETARLTEQTIESVTQNSLAALGIGI
jgi:hypothetical protein